MSIPKILIASGDADSAAELAIRCTSLGYSLPRLAHTPDELLASARASHADLYVIDAALDPTRTPRQLARDVYRVHPAPTIFTTKDEGSAELPHARYGDDGAVLVAPFTDRELRLTIDLALCRHDRAHAAIEFENRFFAVSIDMLCQLDFNGYFRRLNPAWERALGFTIDELKARPFIEFVHPDDREQTLRQNKEVREGGQAVGFENRYRCKDGSYRWLLWNAAADADDHVIFSVARDVTVRKRAEEERERLVGELRTALDEVNVLQDFLPICSYCKKIRDDDDYWSSVESYIARHTNTTFSHGICPDCMEAHIEPQFAKLGVE